MAKKATVKLNYEGIGYLLKCPEMRAIIEGHAQSMADNLGEGYGHRIWYSSKDGRVTAFVGTLTDKAFQKNMEENTVLKAVGGGQND